jgi:hypothetical protein
MRRTTFKPESHGFAFTNFWKFEEAERLHIHDVFIAYFTRRRILGPIGVLLAPPVVRLLRDQLERHLSPHYGLCGGMCFAALDFYLHGGGLSFPRGQHANDQPGQVPGLAGRPELCSPGVAVPRRSQVAPGSIQARVEKAASIRGRRQADGDWADTRDQARL